MINPSQVRAFFDNFNKVVRDQDEKIQNYEWDTWFKLPQTQLLLDLMMMRQFVYKHDMAECDSNSEEFTKKFSRFQGNYEAISDLIDTLSEVQYSKKELKSEEGS